MQHNPFDDQVVRAVVDHMDADHAEDCLAIVRHVGGRPDATAARLVDLDGTGAEFDLEAPSGPGRVRVPWTRTISRRAEIREELAGRVHGLDTGGPGEDAADDA